MSGQGALAAPPVGPARGRPRTGAGGLAGTPVGASGGAVIGAVASPRIRDLLAGQPRPLRVVHRGSAAVYLEADGWCLGVVSVRASRVPCALSVIDRLPLHETARAVAGGGRLRLGFERHPAAELRVRRLADVVVPRLPPAAYDAERTLLPLARPALDELGGTAASLAERVADRPETLLGRGSGLTPLGDDVIAGWAATGYALGAPIAGSDPRPHTTLLSATLIDCARRGEVLPEFRELVLALAGARAEAVRRAAVALAGVGHTSGTGLLLGAALRLLEPQRGEVSR